jgi:hypothetical protein
MGRQSQPKSKGSRQAPASAQADLTRASRARGVGGGGDKPASGDEAKHAKRRRLMEGDTGIEHLTLNARKRIRGAVEDGIEEGQWREWIIFQVELLRHALAEGAIEVEPAIKAAQAIGRQMRDYLASHGDTAAPTAVSINLGLGESQIEKLTAAGISMTSSDSISVH